MGVPVCKRALRGLPGRHRHSQGFKGFTVKKSSKRSFRIMIDGIFAALLRFLRFLLNNLRPRIAFELDLSFVRCRYAVSPLGGLGRKTARRV